MPHPRRLQWRLFPVLLVVALLAGGTMCLCNAWVMSALRGEQSARFISLGWPLVLCALILVGVAWGGSAMIASSLRRSLRHVTGYAERCCEGDLTCRLPLTDSYEIAEFVAAMNRWIMRVDDQFRTALWQRTEQEAMLASMIEGVLAVDSQRRLIKINTAAASLFAVDPLVVQGCDIQEAIQHPDLVAFMDTVLASAEPVEGEIVIRGVDTAHVMQVHGTLLRDDHGSLLGALVVMNDITQLRRLEGMRRDFVANVSHELKTPITAITGFIDTLQDLGGDQQEHMEEFLAIIARHANRLNAIIEDLLTLSRLEQDASAEIQLAMEPLKPLLMAALQVCEGKADEKQITLNLACADNLIVPMNAPLLEQAMINLVDNAIKYSPDGKTVRVTVECGDAGVSIHVRDEGGGIPSEHLPRLFERFYRVDKGRSRKLGGTGLGLAIVKHIVQAHDGSITVESSVGEGSLFSVSLPRSLPANDFVAS